MQGPYLNLELDPLGDPVTTCPIRTGWEFTMESYPSGRLGLLGEQDSQFGNGVVWTQTRTRTDSPEPLLILHPWLTWPGIPGGVQDALRCGFLSNSITAHCHIVLWLGCKTFEWLLPAQGQFCASPSLCVVGTLLPWPFLFNGWDALWMLGGHPPRLQDTVSLLCWTEWSYLPLWLWLWILAGGASCGLSCMCRVLLVSCQCRTGGLHDSPLDALHCVGFKFPYHLIDILHSCHPSEVVCE